MALRPKSVLAVRRFTLADQAAFAKLSGDANPIHMQAEWAATVFPGEIVVHGMHAVLWACDAYIAQNAQQSLRGLKVGFEKPILLDEDVVAISEETSSGVRIHFEVSGTKLMTVDLALAPPTPVASSPLSLGAELPRVVKRGMADAKGLSGRLVLAQNAAELPSIYPALAKALGSTALIGLASLSTLVGMECPGLHSLFHAFEVEIGSVSGPLTYTVIRADTRFNRVDMEVSGYDLRGKVSAFLTGGGAAVSDKDLTVLGVAATEFKGQQPLVIGASSGLGRATARILAAGGAAPVVTWRTAPASIDHLRSEIVDAGGKCVGLPYDTGTPQDFIDALAAMKWPGRQIYFFATPRIFRRRLEAFQSAALREFIAVYVDGFYALVSGLVKTFPDRRFEVFYPSSILAGADGPDSLEYGMAKLAGERLCARLVKTFPQIHIHVERLPGIGTRQTVSVVPTATLPAEDVMLPLVRQMQAENEAPR